MTLQEDNKKIYVKMSKDNIDSAIRINEYKKAFSLLIMVLARLDNDEKVQMIDYYNNKFFDSCKNISHLNDRRFLSTYP
jgi:hypothetical protein